MTKVSSPKARLGNEAQTPPRATVLLQVRTGRIAPLGTMQVPSAIDKQPVEAALRVGPSGLDGDEQGDRRFHGGPEKAVHHYPCDHYLQWRAELPDRADRLIPGGFGENFVTSGWTERNICVGDIVQAGSAVLQVSQGRQPCFKLNQRFDVSDMALRTQRSLRTGWYYRVLEPGVVAAGDRLRIVERTDPAWPLARILHVLYLDCLNHDALADIAALATLAVSWRRLAAARLVNRRVEGWAPRLQGPSYPDAAK